MAQMIDPVTHYQAYYRTLSTDDLANEMQFLTREIRDRRSLGQDDTSISIRYFLAMDEMNTR